MSDFLSRLARRSLEPPVFRPRPASAYETLAEPAPEGLAEVGAARDEPLQPALAASPAPAARQPEAPPEPPWAAPAWGPDQPVPRLLARKAMPGPALPPEAMPPKAMPSGATPSGAITVPMPAPGTENPGTENPGTEDLVTHDLPIQDLGTIAAASPLPRAQPSLPPARMARWQSAPARAPSTPPAGPDTAAAASARAEGIATPAPHFGDALAGPPGAPLPGIAAQLPPTSRPEAPRGTPAAAHWPAAAPPLLRPPPSRAGAAPQPPDIHITIDRIEVRAAAASPATQPAPRQQPAGLTLAEFLHRRARQP